MLDIKNSTKATKVGKIALLSVGALVGFLGLTKAFSYNDSGYCQHVRTIFGNESAKCSTGWYFRGWGRATAWPHEITIANGVDPASGSDVRPPYPVRLADNWRGDITQVTGFQVPQDSDQFLAMARDFRSPDRMISATLRPAVDASLDSVANLFTMEDYYSGGKRDDYKNEFEDTIRKGRARVNRVEVAIQNQIPNRAAPNDLEFAEDTSEVGGTDTRTFRMEKITDAEGNVLRTSHDYVKYGIQVSSAVLSNLDPDDMFEMQQNTRKEAVSRRIVAREQRLEQEEQRLLAIQTGETDIAKRQAEAKVEQIQQTTNAETTKKLALIDAQRRKEEAEIAQKTATIALETARIEAEAKEVTADAAAYEKRVILEADGALQQKLDTYILAQQAWADAASKINVPSTVIAGSGEPGSALGTVDTFMQLMTMRTASELAVDTTIKPVAPVRSPAPAIAAAVKPAAAAIPATRPARTDPDP